MMGCLKRILSLALLLAVVAVAYLNRDKLGRLLHRNAEVETESLGPSQELADSADAKLLTLEEGRAERIVLSEDELQSLLRYKYKTLLPAFVDSPRVRLRGDKIELRARLPVDRLPREGALGDAVGFLPDTTDFSVTGELLPLRTGRVALTVDRVRASGIPLPQRLVPGALTKLGRKDEPGLPATAMAVPLPPGAQSAYVRGDSLVFISSGKRTQ